MVIGIGLLAVLYAFAGVSILGSLFVAFSIWKFGHGRLSTQLVFYLHIGQILQDITMLPEIFYKNDLSCKIAGFFHVYSSMVVVLVIAIMIVYYRQMFFDDKLGMSHFCNHWGREIIFIFSLIALIPFITDGYGIVGDSLCILTKSNPYNIIVLLVCFLIGLASLIVMVHTTATIYYYNADLGCNLMKSIDSYAVCTYIFWIPRVVFELTDNYNETTVIASYFLVYCCGLVYCVIFLREKHSMKMFERSRQLDSVCLSQTSDSEPFDANWDRSSVYSWEEECAETSIGHPHHPHHTATNVMESGFPVKSPRKIQDTPRPPPMSRTPRGLNGGAAGGSVLKGLFRVPANTSNSEDSGAPVTPRHVSAAAVRAGLFVPLSLKQPSNAGRNSKDGSATSNTSGNTSGNSTANSNAASTTGSNSRNQQTYVRSPRVFVVASGNQNTHNTTTSATTAVTATVDTESATTAVDVLQAPLTSNPIRNVTLSHLIIPK